MSTSMHGGCSIRVYACNKQQCTDADYKNLACGYIANGCLIGGSKG